MSNFNLAFFTDSLLSTIGEWLPRGWVWRKSALGPLQTLLTVMNMVAFGNKGYRAALRDVFADMHRAFGWSKGAPTPSALTQARGKLSEKMCRDLFHRVARKRRTNPLTLVCDMWIFNGSSLQMEPGWRWPQPQL